MEVVYHHRTHSQTGQTPLARFESAGTPLLATPALLREAFLWSVERTVTKTATVSLHSNQYEVDAALVGRKVELVFDPFDLTRIEVRYKHRPCGYAVPLLIGRHTHPQAERELPPSPEPSGIDYLKLLADKRDAELGGQRIDYANLIEDHADSANDEEVAIVDGDGDGDNGGGENVTIANADGDGDGEGDGEDRDNNQEGNSR